MKKPSPVRTGAAPKKGPAESQYDLMQYKAGIEPHNGPIGYAYPSKHATAYKRTRRGVGQGATVTTDRKYDEIDRTPIRTWASARTDEYTGRGASEATVGPLQPQARREGPVRYGSVLKAEKPGREPDQLRGKVVPQVGYVYARKYER